MITAPISVLLFSKSRNLSFQNTLLSSMEADPLLPFSNSPKFKPSPLSPVPEHTEITVPLHFPHTPSSSSSSSSSSSQTLFSPLLFPQSTPSFNRKTSLHRSKTAPALATFNDVVPRPERPQFSSQSIVRQAIALLTMYLSLGVVIYWSQRDGFSATETHPVVDALYFCIVTMCTIGYGDITPNSPATKLFSILFVLIGFGFVDILLTGMVSYVLDLQEGYLLRNVKDASVDIDIDGANGAARVIGSGSGSGRSNNHHGKERREASLIVDIKKGRMRIRMKVALALGVVIVCIGVGTGVMHFVEELSWLDSLYLSVMSVTTVGYGDRAFRSMPGRIFASIWLLVSTLAVARAFLYLAEARVDKRQRRMAKWVLGHDMTISEFIAADLDNNGFVSKSEYVIYKLKEMGKVSNKDVAEICTKFDRIDTSNCGKIALADLMGSQQ